MKEKLQYKHNERNSKLDQKSRSRRYKNFNQKKIRESHRSKIEKESQLTSLIEAVPSQLSEKPKLKNESKSLLEPQKNQKLSK